MLHGLRHVVEDATSFQNLRTHGDSPELKYGTATTEQFQAICEEESGQDLAAFFQQWIYDEYYTKYTVAWHTAQDSLYVTI